MTLALLRVLTWLVVASLAALILWAGEASKLWWWALAIPFGLWVIGPAVLPYLLAKRLREPWTIVALTTFLILSSGWSAMAYYNAFVRSESSTAALVMIFAPLYQWFALGCITLAMLITAKLSRRG